MVAAAHRYPLIREFSTTSDAKVVVSGRLMEYRNTNQLVKVPTWDIGLSDRFHPGSRQVPRHAGARCEKPVVIVLLDSQGKLTRIGDANRIKRWMETTQASAARKSGSAWSDARAPRGDLPEAL